MKSLSVFLVLLFSFTANAADLYKTIYDSVALAPIWANLRLMTGYDPVTIKGKTFSIPERKSDVDKKHFREFFVSYFEQLGIPVQEQPYKGGVNVEAVLPGKSADSFIVISHYDSAGAPGNPAVDDAASGIAIMLEAAKYLVSYRGHLDHTVRFVVADHEEDNGSGDYAYADHIEKTAAAGHFKALASVDFDQSGWVSKRNDGNQIDVYIRDAVKTKWLIYPMLEVIKSYSTLVPHVRPLAGALVDSDFLEPKGIPGICPSEMDNAYNPFKDVKGDTLDTIDQNYYLKIAKVDITFLVKVVGVSP